eukprot:TCALIF_13706-PA protein Name:"Similar to pol Retrovirus-related Pol polyprotein from transposon gypsy (Drosophila melanogaster)" AED:0.33 eAED:0.38 QI:0/0/0/0.71/0/0/7/0/476
MPDVRPVEVSKLWEAEGLVQPCQVRMRAFSEALVKCKVVAEAHDVHEDDKHTNDCDDLKLALGKACAAINALRLRADEEHRRGRSEHEERVQRVFHKCQEAGITLGQKKFIYAQPQVIWCGFNLTNTGTLSIRNLSVACEGSQCQEIEWTFEHFQFEAFSAEIAGLSEPIRAMLSPKVPFLWEGSQQHSFDKIINVLMSPRVLTQYRPGAQLWLETDAALARNGCSANPRPGFALWQEQGPIWKLLQCGSRAVTPTESRYSLTKIELLAVVWAIKKCFMFLRGAEFDLVVDHKPLVPIINFKTLNQIQTPRIMRLKEKLAYSFPTAIWRAGVDHTVDDVFSRYPVEAPNEDDLLGETELEDFVKVTTKAAMLKEHRVKQTAEQDASYQKLLEAIRDGFPDHIQKVDLSVRPFWPVRQGLSVGNTIALHECEIVKPSQQKEPLKQDDAAEWPGEAVSADLFSHAGNEFLLLVDKYSR